MRDAYMRDAYMRDKIAENIMKLTINYKKVSFNAHFKILGIGTGVTSVKIPIKQKSETKIINNRDIEKYIALPPMDLPNSNLLEDAIKEAINYKSDN